MRPVTRGFLTSVLWLALALGFTGALSNFLQDRHVGAAPAEAGEIVR